MEDIGQSFRLGIWAVKPEKRVEFIEAWQTSTDWLLERLPNERGAVLLEDTNNPGRFISFAPVSDNKVNEVANELMSDPDYQVLWARVLEFCDDVEPNFMRVVSSVTGQNASV